MSKKKNILEDYPYRAQFDGIQIKAVSLTSSELTHIAQASADKLKSLLPAGFDFDVNYDILGVAFNAYTPNLGNRNGHMISGHKGIDIAASFKGKYINIEHERKNIVGTITDFGFSTFPDDNVITEVEARELADQGKIFNVVLSGLIWRAVNPDFADDVENAGDITSDSFGSISASWEVAFKEFSVASGSKYLDKCIIIEDSEGCGKLKKSLKTFGGRGCDAEGTPLYLNLVGNTILSMGIGLTSNPAAEVSGITTSAKNEEENSQEASVEHAAEKKSDKNSLENVIIEDASAKKNMKLTKIEDITDEAMKEISASAMTTFIADELAKSSEQWKKQLDEKATLGTTLTEQMANLQAQLDEMKVSKETSETELESLKSQISAAEFEEFFQTHMASIDDTYELTDEERAIIAVEVKACASEEDFTKWMAKFSVLSKEKSKEIIAARSKEIEALKSQAVVVTASEEAPVVEEVAVAPVVVAPVVVETPAADAIAAASVTNDLSNAGGTTVSLKDRMASAFGGENIKITLK